MDLVYIANLHPQHKDTVLTMTKHKKSILCEKPLSVNKKETQIMVDAAKEAGVFFMAGLWSRFFPAQKLSVLFPSFTLLKSQHIHPLSVCCRS